MAQQIRSADLMVRLALSDPSKLEALRQDPAKAIKEMAAEAMRQVPDPSPPATDWIWLIIVGAFASVMVGSAYVLGTTVTAEAKTGLTYITKSETVVTVFTTTVAFLAGLIAPSPVKKT